MAPKIRTKTLVSTLQSLLICPTTESGDVVGDVLPEALLVSNILDELLFNLGVVSALLCDQLHPDQLPQHVRLRVQCLKQAAPGYGLIKQPAEEYDAEVEDRRKPPRLPEQPEEPREHDQLVKGLLIAIRGDQSLCRSLARVWCPEQQDPRGSSRPSSSLSTFMQLAEQLQRYSGSALAKLYGVYVTERESLCRSICATERLEKHVSKMRLQLDQILQERCHLLQVKAQDKEQLQQNMDAVNQQSRQVISELKRNVDSRIENLAWKSHARQTKLLEVMVGLKQQLHRSTKHHFSMETELRHTNIRMQEQIDRMIGHYDHHMFTLHAAMEELKKQRGLLKALLYQAQGQLDEAQRRQQAVLQKQRQEEAEERDRALLFIRRSVAAKTIQRAWRSYRLTMAAKVKKKKKKSSNVPCRLGPEV